MSAEQIQPLFNFFSGVILPIITHPAINIITLLIGWIIGNRMAIGRDKRKEFNIVVEPIRNKFLNSKGKAISIEIQEHDIIDIRNGLWFFNRFRFNRAIKKYQKATSQENMKSDGMGGFIYIDESKIINTHNNVFKYLNKK